MSNNPEHSRNYGWSSSQQSTHHQNGPTGTSIRRLQPEFVRRSEDAQPNLDEGKNLRPAHFHIGRREPEPAPPEVLASSSIRPSTSTSGRLPSSNTGVQGRSSGPANRTSLGNGQVPTGPRAGNPTSSIANASKESWPQRGQKSNYTPSSTAGNAGYTGNLSTANSPTTIDAGRARLTDEGQAYRSPAKQSAANAFQSNATSTSGPTAARPSVPLPSFRPAQASTQSSAGPTPVLPNPVARNPLFRPPTNARTTASRPDAGPSTSVQTARLSTQSSTSNPTRPATSDAGPSLFRPRSPSPADVKPDIRNLRQEPGPTSTYRSSASTSEIHHTIRSNITNVPNDAEMAQAVSLRTNSHSATGIFNERHLDRDADQRMADAEPSDSGRANSFASPANASARTQDMGANAYVEQHIEVFPLPLECRHAGGPLPISVQEKRPLFIQSLYEDLEIQHTKPILSLHTSFLDEEVELTYQFEEMRPNEICIRLPVSLRRSNAHFAGSVTAARESFKLEQVTSFAVQGKIAKETRFTYAHLAIRFGEPARTASRSSSTVPLRGSMPPSSSGQTSRVHAVQQQDTFVAPAPRGSPLATPRVKQEPGSPAANAAPGESDTSSAAAAAVPAAREPTPPPPKPLHPGFPLDAKASYTDVQLTRNNVDAFLQIFLDRFENKRSGGRLIDYYSQDASFSYTDTTGPPGVNGKDTRTAIRAYGQYPITNTMKKIPVCTLARDAAGKIFYDATRVGVSTNPLAFLPVIVNLHGNFKELESGIERSFDRTIYLQPVAGGNSYGGAAGLQYTIQSDQIFVRPLVDHQDWFIGKLPPRRVPPTGPAAQKQPAQQPRRPFVREQSIMLPMPELDSTAVQRAIVDASRQQMDRDLGITARPSNSTTSRARPTPANAQQKAPTAGSARRPAQTPATSVAQANGQAGPSRPRPVVTGTVRNAEPVPASTAKTSASRPIATQNAASTSTAQAGPSSAPKVPMKRPIIEIDDSDDDLPETERLVSQSSTVHAGPADARRVKQRMQESFAAGSTSKASIRAVSPELAGPPEPQPAPAPPPAKKAKKAKVPQPPPVPSHDPDTGRKLTKGEKKAIRKAQAAEDATTPSAANADSAKPKRPKPGPEAFRFGQQSTISHSMHGVGNRARKMFPLEALGGYLSVNFRGNLYYWKGDSTPVQSCSLDKDGDDRLQVDDCLWSEKHQTAILGYACPNVGSAGEARPSTQLAIVKADEAIVDNYGEMSGLNREILDATPHDKVGITSLALLEQGGDHNLSFASAGNDRKISLWTVPKDGRQNVRCRSIATTHTSRITSMVWKRQGNHLVTGGMDKRLCLMDLGAGKAKTVSETREALPINHVLLHKGHHALLCLLNLKDQFKYVDLRSPDSAKGLTFGRPLSKVLGSFTHGEWRDNLFAYAFDDVVAIWDIRNTSKPREEKFGSSGVIQPHFESDHTLTLLEKKHFTKVSYTYAAQ